MSFSTPILDGLRGFADWLIRTKTKLWVGKVLSAVGLGLVANEFIYDPMIEQVQQYWGMVPATVATWVSRLRLDYAVSVVLSAYGIRNAHRIFARKVEQAQGTEP